MIQGDEIEAVSSKDSEFLVKIKMAGFADSIRFRAERKGRASHDSKFLACTTR